MYDFGTYFIVAPNPIDVTSIVIEKLSDCHSTSITWKVRIHNQYVYVITYIILLLQVH